MVDSPESVLRTAMARVDGYGVGYMKVLCSGSGQETDPRILVYGPDQLERDFLETIADKYFDGVRGQLVVYFSSNHNGVIELLRQEDIGLLVYHPSQRGQMKPNPSMFARTYCRDIAPEVLEAVLLGSRYHISGNYPPQMVKKYQQIFKGDLAQKIRELQKQNS